MKGGGNTAASAAPGIYADNGKLTHQRRRKGDAVVYGILSVGKENVPQFSQFGDRQCAPAGQRGHAQGYVNAALTQHPHEIRCGTAADLEGNVRVFFREAGKHREQRGI